jgi:hypothetical protein
MTSLGFGPLVFVNGSLLHHEDVRVEPSALDPGACIVIIKQSPRLPQAIAELVDYPVGEKGEKLDPSRYWARVLAPATAAPPGAPPTAGLPVWVEMRVTEIRLSGGGPKEPPQP